MHDDEPPVEVTIGPPHAAGVWANIVDVIRSDHEFTVDFARIDFGSDVPRRATLVARVAMSPQLVMQLMEMLDRAWRQYTRTALPDAVFGNGFEEDQDQEDLPPD